MERVSSSTEERPSPDVIEEFLPWAARQLEMAVPLHVTRLHQQDYVSRMPARSKIRTKGKSRIEVATSALEIDEKQYISSSVNDVNARINVKAIYDNNDHLVQIKFCNNRSIPCQVFRLIAMILEFQPYLTAISLDSGVDCVALHELRGVLARPEARVTDLCLDGCNLRDSTFYLLLGLPSLLRNLSLSRCCIDDVMVQHIATALVPPRAAAVMLIALNLSTNRITDVGAGYLAEALRSNRKLGYLNLASNLITDDGAGAILSHLVEFLLTDDEILGMRSRKLDFLKQKLTMIDETVAGMRVNDEDRKSMKKKPVRAIPLRKTTLKSVYLEKEASLKNISKTVDAFYYEKASKMVEKTMGEFNHAFGGNNTVLRDGAVYCRGNNTLSYLNIAYNNVEYPTLRRLLAVLKYQERMARAPRGLVNVRVEGNNLPVACTELHCIDDILEIGLLPRRSGIKKGRVP